MKKNLVFMVTLCVVVFASYANAAATEVVKKELIERTTTDKVVASSTTPVVAKAKTVKKKKSMPKKKKRVEKVVDAAQVAPAAISPAASVDMVPSSLDITMADGKKYVASVATTTTSAADLTKTAKKKSGNSIRIKIDLLSVFMPDGVSSTARRDWLQVGYAMRFPNGVDTSGQPVGFQTAVSDQGVVANELTLGVKYKMVGVQYDPLPYSRTVGYKFYGSTLGKYEVTTLAKLVGKIYWYDGQNLSSSVGLGYEYTQISGAIKMGGFPFKTTGDGWIPFMQLEGSYHFNRTWSATLGWEMGGPKLVTEIPGAPDIITSMPYRGTMKLTANLVELLALPFGK